MGLSGGRRGILSFLFLRPTDFCVTSHSQQSVPGNKLQPGQFPRGVTEADAETQESAPRPGKPSEMGLSVDDISSCCSGFVSPGNCWTTLPPSALAPLCLRHTPARGQLTLVGHRWFGLGWPKLPMVNPCVQHVRHSKPTQASTTEAWECSFAVSFLPPLLSLKPHKQLQLEEARRRKEGCS